MKTLPPTYDTPTTEARLQQQWEAEGVYRYDATLPREQTFVIDTPPPTVSGQLHMGHIFSYTQTDFVARYQRMSGKTVFYPMGFDDNGLPTERLVEKTKKIQAHRYITEHGREGFVALCEEVVAGALKEFRDLFTSISLSVDWALQYDTISPRVQALSQASFLDLMEKNHVERRLQPMVWDPVDQTAIAQAEIEDKEHASAMHTLHFSVEGTAEKLPIATTRPELLAACVAVMIHPEDPRLERLKGKNILTPVFGVAVPLIADEKVKMDKGTGVVMCCTFGDQTDVEWWKAHQLPARIILNKYGKIMPRAELDFELPEVFEALQGMKAREQARAKMLELLQAEGAFVESKPITHIEPCAERSGAPLEILPTYQWFVKLLDKKEALKARNNSLAWHPEFMRIRMEQWIDGLKWDWCISRQRYFGVPFPVWYSNRAGEEGKILLAHPDDLPVNPLKDLPRGYTRDKVIADPDVMDTWATSSLSPHINAGTLHGAPLLPADLRPQAHEIIRTWAFYTLVKAHLHNDDIPWKSLMISGWCLAADKTKMSKSKGNVVTPQDLIVKNGADAVRFWASTSRLGADTAFSEDLLKIGRKLVNKIWNASNFVATNLAKRTVTPTTAAADIASGVIDQPLDQWILSRLHHTVKAATACFEAYEYCDARVAVEEFFWKDFCDNYLELVKTRAYGESTGGIGQQSALVTLTHCLHTILRLFAPFVPHVTEEIYSHVFAEERDAQGSLHRRGNWPRLHDFAATDETAGFAAVAALGAIRKLKAEKNVSIKTPLEHITLQLPPHINEAQFSGVLADVLAAGNALASSFGAPTHPDTASSEDGTLVVSGAFAAQAAA